MAIQRAAVGAIGAGALALAGLAGSLAGRPAAPAAHVLTRPGTGVTLLTSTGAPDLTDLQRMAAALATTPHDVTMTTEGSTISGSVSPGRNAAVVARASGLEIDEVVSQGQVYLKANLGSDLDTEVGIRPDQWMKLDPAQIEPGNNELLVQPDSADPVDLKGIMAGMTTLRRMDGQHLRGTIDLTKVSGHTLPDPDEVAKSGTAATNVPFTVAADAQGRISEFVIDADGFDPQLSLTVRYTSYGTADAVTPPADAVPAPDGVYTIFND